MRTRLSKWNLTTFRGYQPNGLLNLGILPGSEGPFCHSGVRERHLVAKETLADSHGPQWALKQFMEGIQKEEEKTIKNINIAFGSMWLQVSRICSATLWKVTGPRQATKSCSIKEMSQSPSWAQTIRGGYLAGSRGEESSDGFPSMSYFRTTSPKFSERRHSEWWVVCKSVTTSSRWARHSKVHPAKTTLWGTLAC